MELISKIFEHKTELLYVSLGLLLLCVMGTQTLTCIALDKELLSTEKRLNESMDASGSLAYEMCRFRTQGQLTNYTTEYIQTEYTDKNTTKNASIIELKCFSDKGNEFEYLGKSYEEVTIRIPLYES